MPNPLWETLRYRVIRPPQVVLETCRSYSGKPARRANNRIQGQKQVWLPSFTITMLRTSYLAPNMAMFQVPLNMNKLDIRDYLWHAYNVPVRTVRSYITQQRVRSGKASDIVFRSRYWTRPKSTKRMIVELGNGANGGPFVWPEEIKDLEPWENKTFEDLREAEKERETSQTKGNNYRSEDDRKLLAEQAKELLEGKKQWQPLIPAYNQQRIGV